MYWRARGCKNDASADCRPRQSCLRFDDDVRARPILIVNFSGKQYFDAMDKPILTPLEPVYIKKNPDPWLRNLRPLTFDEFIEYRGAVSVDKRSSNCRQAEPSSAVRARKSMFDDNNASNAQASTVYIAENDALYKAFKPPSFVQTRDLFLNYYDPADSHCYLRHRNRMFTGFNKHYQSAPQTTYAGLSEWLYVVAGKLVVWTYQPTEINLLKMRSWEGSKLDPSLGPPAAEYVLERDSCLVIPGGWITVRRAASSTFILNGEFLNADDVANQLELFARDVRLSHNSHALERDSNIRYCYWLYLAKLLDSDRNLINTIDLQTVTKLRDHAAAWARLAEREQLNPFQYIPENIKVKRLYKSLMDYIYKRGKQPARAINSSA